MLREYIAYIKDNPKGYWFKSRLYGWGWVPVTWQGWLVTGVYLGVIILLGLNSDKDSTTKALILPLVILTGILIGIAYKKGEKLRWMWGLPKNKG